MTLRDHYRQSLLLIAVFGVNCLCESKAEGIATSFRGGLPHVVVRADGTGDVPDIQTALDVAADSALIELDNGTFTGPRNRDLDFLGKKITLRSLNDDPSACVIDCNGAARAISLAESGQPAVVEGITFVNGSAIEGGSIRSPGTELLTLRNCTLMNNRATSGGGFYGSVKEMARCRFVGNIAHDSGGGARCTSGEIMDCVFENNQAADTAGGLLILGGSISECEFRGNSASLGGGIRGDGVSIVNCRFFDNAASFYGGGAELYASTAEGCLFGWNAAAEYAGAVYGDNLECRYSTFVGNTSESGVSTIVASDSRIYNSVFAGNGPDIQFCGQTSHPMRMYCCDCWNETVQEECCSGGDNISADPRFCSVDSMDFRLSPDSPCVGDPCGIMGAFPLGCESTSDVTDDPAPESVYSPIRIGPNPSRAATSVAIHLTTNSEPLASGGSYLVQIFDVAGRIVRELTPGTSAMGDVLQWDMRDEKGEAVPAGVYVARVRLLDANGATSSVGTARVVIVQ